MPGKINMVDKTAQIKITIVTITYNADEFLEKTILSVIEQDYQFVEFIIIDGGSQDGTVDIIKKYEKYITYWISEPDRGIYDAMNKGIDVATGEWINFMNAGDTFFENGTISNVSREFDDQHELICGDILRGIDNKSYRKPLGLKYAFDAMFVWHQALFTKMFLMKQFKFNADFKIAADYEFVLRCFYYGYNFKFIDFPIANFIEGGISQNNNTLSRVEAMYVQSKYLEKIDDIFEHSFYNELVNSNKNNQLFSKLQYQFYKQLDEILKDKQFVLYGFGTVGELIYNKYKENIIAIVDKEYVTLKRKYGLEIFNPNRLKEIKFDYVFISVLGREEDIKLYLQQECCNDEIKTLEVSL